MKKRKILFILRIVAIKNQVLKVWLNKLSGKSDKSISDSSLDPLSEIENLRLKSVNKYNTNINPPLNKFEQSLL